MSTKQKTIVAVGIIAIFGSGIYFFHEQLGLKRSKVAPIEITNKQAVENTGPANPENVSPISGVACDNWNKRPIAVMQPADVSARPAAGFSQADLVFEMPVFTNSNTRLMGVYLCDIPKDIGSMRSARHDYIPLAKGLDAVFVSWGYSKFAETLLGQKVIDNIDCLTSSYCPRWTGVDRTAKMKLEDTGRITKAGIEKAMADLKYRTTGTFSGYPHQEEAPVSERPAGGHLRLAYPNPYDVDYDYDMKTNSYVRSWDSVADTDKNNGNQIAPKNIAVLIVDDEQIKLSTDYKARGVQDPWQLVPEADRAGLDYGGVGRYNNLNMGDPWFDTKDSGDALFYFNGQQYKGTWKKDKSKLESKLMFLNEDGSEVKFVPGEIWVNVMEPGMGIKWDPAV